MINTTWGKHIFKDFSSVKGRNVLVRLDLNLPTTDGKITETSRLDSIIPFINKLCFAGAKVIVLSHFGEKGESLKPVADLFCKNIPFSKFLSSTDFVEIKNELNKIGNGSVLLLENTRMFVGETENLSSLAKSFSELGDIFINDAFSVSHREHASIVGIPNYLLSYLGPTFEKELSHLSKILTPEKPALLILGGAKISTKLDLIKKYIDEGIKVFVGGAMANNILKQKGFEIGERSFYDKTATLTENILNNPNLITPIDVVLDNHENALLKEIPKNARIVDCGKETIKQLSKIITESKTVIMNGPLGLYEEGYLFSTESVLNLISQKEKDSNYIGGGDTVSVAKSLNLVNNIGYVSLGGGAMLEYLANGTLIGIDAVTK